MKKLLFSATIILGLTFSGNAQSFVSTTPENKNVVLEVFGGYYCTYNADGDRLAQELVNDNPGDVFFINVHAGGYANPGTSGDPDFRTFFGDALRIQSSVTGYPAGTINRHNFSAQGWSQAGGTAMNRADWDTATAVSLGEQSYVNIAAEATINFTTRILTVNVEAYYTADGAASNNVTVALLQNNVEGPHVGGSTWNPDLVLPNGKYNHMHMLRHLLTGQWGDTTTVTATGSLYQNTFTYTIPADLNGVAYELADLEVVVFIAEGQQEILSGANAALTYTGINETNNAALVSIDELGSVCGTTVSPIVTIRNKGVADLVNLDITYDVNGGTSQSYSWTGNLSAYKKETVTLPPIAYTGSGTNTVNVVFSNPNGSTDEDTSDDQASSSFTDAPQTDVVLAFELLTDDYGSETTWDLVDASGTVLYSGGPYANNTTYNETFNLSEGCHTFTIYDSYGDGMSYGTPGYYEITDVGSNVIFTGANFGSSDISPFESVCASFGTITLSSIDPNCGSFDGSASCTVSGTSGPYTYQWSNGQTTSTATNLAAGAYSVTVTNALTCSEAKSIILNNVGAATLSSFAPQNACWNIADGIINLTVTGGTSPFTYTWSNGATTSNLTGLSTGTYTVTVTDVGGCISLNTTEVTAPSAIAVLTTVNDENFGNDGSIYLSTSGGVGTYTYSWTGPNAYTASTEDITGLAGGSYLVTIADGFGCILTQSFTVTPGQVGISSIEEAPVDMTVFPNPFSESTTVQFTLRKAEKVSIGVYNLAGQEIHRVDEGILNEGKHQLTVNGSELVPAVYFVILTIGKQSQLRKIIHTK